MTPSSMASSSDPVDFSKPIDRIVLKDRGALVTGGASGVGAGIVRALAEAGAYVTIADINPAVSNEYSAAPRVQSVKVDVTDWSSQVRAFQQAHAFSPSKNVDIVIACAGIAGAPMIQSPPFTDTGEVPQPPDVQVKMINVNLVGPMYTATLAAHYWRKQTSPAVDNVLIIVASGISYFPSAGFTGYTASKMGVRGLWKSLRADPSFAGLFRTNLLSPHIVRTPLTTELQPYLDSHGVKFVEVSECVDCLLRLCCDGEIRGRAIQVNPKDWFDLGDDMEGFEGAAAFREHFTPEIKATFDLVNPSKTMS